MEKETKLLSVLESAEILGITRARVNQLIDEGKLPAQKVGRAFILRESDLDLLKNRKVGRPKKNGIESKETKQ